MTVRICDRCGEITLDAEGCSCTTPHSLREVHRRHRAAVESARTTTGLASIPTRPESGGASTAPRAAGARPLVRADVEPIRWCHHAHLHRRSGV